MTTSRQTYLQIANSIRKSIPAALDVRQQHKLVIVTRTWEGSRIGADGGYHDTRLELVERYKARHVTQREILASGGLYEAGQISVGPITPTDGDPLTGAGGTTGYCIHQLRPDTAPRIGKRTQEVFYELSGPHQGVYKCVGAETLKDLSWYLILERMQNVPTIR